MFLGRDMGHIRDYSEDIAEIVDEEVRRLIENAHDEAWEILVENRDVLDALVLQLLEKETLDKAEVAAIFAPVQKLPQRPVWLSSDRRPVLRPAPGQLAQGAQRGPTGRPPNGSHRQRRYAVPVDERPGRLTGDRSRRPRVDGEPPSRRAYRPGSRRGGGPRAAARRR